ncbi:hypothetical protein JCM24511_04222 [Saitozyma sp. JCM 24511]|nr:hypothetical protein JCM24511_04222 [Saitozyma sp. JCM 24511]
MLNGLSLNASYLSSTSPRPVGSGVSPLSPTTTVASQRPPRPFQRSTFLAVFNDAARTLDADPYKGMAILETGLDALLGTDQLKPELEEERVIYARIDQPRRDLRKEYDVLDCGLIGERDVSDLLRVYWSRCNPLIRILDPHIYTLPYIRSTSATLLTAILQAAAQCLPVSGHSASLVERLDGHMDWLLLEVQKHGYQSMEISQALVIFTTFLRGLKQNQTWALLTQSLLMAVELRLDAIHPPSWFLLESIHGHIPQPRMARNIQRTWMILLERDRSLAFIRGRRGLIRDAVFLQEQALDSWWRVTGALDIDVVTCAMLSMRTLVESTQIDAQQAIVKGSDFAFDRYHVAVDKALEDWQSRWLNRLDPGAHPSILHDLKCARFVVLMASIEHQLLAGGVERAARDECLVAGIEVCKTALPFLSGEPKGLPLAPAKLYLICYTAFAALRIMDGSPSSSDTNVDLFHLAIIASLSYSLIHLKIHPNLGCIASVLGRRLLFATRKLASSILGSAPAAENNTMPVGEAPSADNSADVTSTGDGFSLDPNFDFFDLHEQTQAPSFAGGGGQGGSLDPQDTAFSFDLSHFGDLFAFLGGDADVNSGMATGDGWESLFGSTM